MMKSPRYPDEQGILLDIDDTLVDTSISCAHALWDIAPLFEFTSPEDALTSYGIPEKIPEWQTPECQKLLHHCLTSTDFLSSLPVIPLAHEGVSVLVTTHPILGYLTSRLPFAWETTVNWLKKHGFPEAPVIYRFPDVTERDWKVRYIEENMPHSAGIVDNELYVPPEARYRGKLVELMRFRLVSVFDERKIICHNWQEVAAAFASLD